MRLLHPAGSSPRRLLPVLLLLAVLMAACLPAELEAAPTEPPPTENPPLAPTDTIVWFPATATYTPVPTREFTPTPDLRPSEGAALLTDAFTDGESWQTLRSAAGSVAYGREELTLAVSAPRGMLVSYRQTPTLADFYLEIEAEPSLCRGGDAYGLLLRAHSNQDFYRLLLNCDGEVRFERLSDARALPLKDWSYAGLPPGGMIPVRVGVWALKDEMRIFVNDMHQFTVRDTAWTAGQLGVFARSAGETPLTVSFSRLSVYPIAGGRLPLPTQTAVPPRPSATPRP